jgi:anaerobic dimethyl sulfoxide reductase subunit A
MNNKDFLTKALTDTVLTRRSFLKWSAALGGTAVVAGGISYGLKAAGAMAEKAAGEGGKWVSAACWHNCGGRCLVKAYVKDGVVTRVKTDDTHPDSPDYPQQRACARGRSQRYQVFSADRIKYPLKRKNWEPGGGKKELRGQDEWVRITWDEALDILASELTRIREKYGPESIFKGNSAVAASGGYVNNWGSTSTGTYSQTGPRVGLTSSGGYNDRLDLRKSKLFFMIGENPIWSSGGSPTYHYLQAKRAGAKFIFMDPLYNDSAMVLADEWVPIRPATDSAFLLGMAHTMLTRDSAEFPLIDWDFVKRCTVGFDKDSLPEGADPEDNFTDYVLGLDASGNPAPEGHKNYPAKTAEWASEICGIPPDKIRSLTLEAATTKPMTFMIGWCCARTNDNQHHPQIVAAVGAMLGVLGREGCGIGPSSHSGNANGGPALVRSGSAGTPNIENPLSDTRINNNEMWNAVLTGKYINGEEKSINIQMIYHASGAHLQTRTGMTKGIQAHRKVEFVVSHAQFETTNARYSDLILPVTTQWERYGSTNTGNREALFWASQVVEPMGECKDDEWIERELAKRLGLNVDELYPLSDKQQLFNRIAGATVMTEDGSGYEPLVTITDADIKELGVEGVPQTGRISFMEFKERGVYQVPRSPGDNYGYIAFKAFREDPEANPLETDSGKLELHCQALADYISGVGFSTIRPNAVYDRVTEGYEDTFADWDNKIKGEFPLQLYNIHHPRRSHTVFDNVIELRQAFDQEFYMNPMDAEERGIKNGDTVLVTGKHGKVVRQAFVTERMMPGVVTLPHGAWVDMDEKNQIDRAGADNILSGDIARVEGHMGWNSTIVQVEKYVGEPVGPDYKQPRRILYKE